MSSMKIIDVTKWHPWVRYPWWCTPFKFAEQREDGLWYLVMSLPPEEPCQRWETFRLTSAKGWKNIAQLRFALLRYKTGRIVLDHIDADVLIRPIQPAKFIPLVLTADQAGATFQQSS